MSGLKDVEVFRKFLHSKLKTGDSSFDIGHNSAINDILDAIDGQQFFEDTEEFDDSMLNIDTLKSEVRISHLRQLILETNYRDIPSERELREIVSFVDSRQKLQAIKTLKEVTGLGLKEAKDVIDQL